MKAIDLLKFLFVLIILCGVFTHHPVYAQDLISDQVLCDTNPLSYEAVINRTTYLDFDIAEQRYVNLNVLEPTLKASNRSVFMWIKKSADVDGDPQVLFAINTDNGRNQSAFQITNDQKLGIDNGAFLANVKSDALDNEWHHVGYTYAHDGNDISIYIDGELVKTSSKNHDAEAGDLYSLGQYYDRSNLGSFFDGKMAEVSIWNEILDASEIDLLMKRKIENSHPKYNNLVAYYPMRENVITASVLKDESSNGNDGTVIGAIQDANNFENVSGFNTVGWYDISWQKNGQEIGTANSIDITPTEGTHTYTLVGNGTVTFESWDLSYTNLLPNQATDKTGGVGGNVTLEVDDIPGASYQWYKKTSSRETVSAGENGILPTIRFNEVSVSNGVIYLSSNDGLNISRDNAKSWTNVTAATPGYSSNNNNNAYRLHSSDETVLVANYQGGLSISKDAGVTWRNINANNTPGFESTSWVGDVFSHGDNFYAIGSKDGSGQFYTSKDGGNTWTSKAPTFAESSVGLNSNSNSLFVDGSNIYIGIPSNLGGDVTLKGGILISKDGGATWTRKIPGVDGFPGEAATTKKVYSNNGVIYVLASAKFYISRDGGDTWNEASGITGFGSITDVHSSGNRVYVSNAGIQFTDDDGLTWSSLEKTNTGSILSVFGTEENVFFIENSTNLSFSTSSSKISDEPDNTAFNQIQGATTHQLTINNLTLDENEAEYFVVVSKDGCEQTSDYAALTVLDVPGIESISPAASSSDVSIDVPVTITFNKDITKGSGNVRIIEYATDTEKQSFAIGEATQVGRVVTLPAASLDYDTRYYLAMDAGVVVDNSSGGSLAVTDKEKYSFTTVCEPLVLTQPTDQTGGVAGSATFSATEVAGASYQWYQSGDGQYVSNNLGQPDSFIEVKTVFAVGESIYVGTSSQSLLISSDKGATWATTTSGQNGFANSTSINAVYAVGNNIYVGTEAGVSISTDGGTNWTTSTFSKLGLLSNSVTSVFAAGNNVYVGTSNAFNLGGISISTDGGSS